MSFSFFISKKYTFSKKDSKFITFISSISIIGIALGVATLIIALSILNGFEQTITNKIISFDSHIRITSYKNILPNYHEALPLIKKDVKPYVTSVTPFVSKLAIISSKYEKEGVSIKGIIPNEKWNGVKNDIIEGKYDFSSKNNLPSIIIGKKLANKLLINVGDKVTIFALDKNEIPSPQNMPNIEQFRISGIFESGMSAYDDLNAYIDLKSAQKLFNIGDNVTGYDIKLNNITKIDSLTSFLRNTLGYPYSVRSIYQIYRGIFTWISLQKKPIPIILGLIIVVAVFNIIGTLLMIVLEKTNAIGILKSMGANKKQIISIFVIQGIFLAIAGIILGNILAFVLMNLQLHYNIISLPSSIYLMSKVPILLSVHTFVLVSIITFVLCIIASFIPSYIASKVQPISSLRFN